MNYSFVKLYHWKARRGVYNRILTLSLSLLLSYTYNHNWKKCFPLFLSVFNQVQGHNGSGQEGANGCTQFSVNYYFFSQFSVNY